MFLVYAALPYALISACSPAKPTNEHVPGLQFIIIIPLALFFLSAVFYWIVKYLESRKK
jgi:hypothetical protein